MNKALPPHVISTGPCDCCGRPATVGVVDLLEMYPHEDEDGTLWRTFIAFGDPYFRCPRHDPEAHGNRTEWSVHEHEDPYQSRESVRAAERRLYSWPK